MVTKITFTFIIVTLLHSGHHIDIFVPNLQIILFKLGSIIYTYCHIFVIYGHSRYFKINKYRLLGVCEEILDSERFQLTISPIYLHKKSYIILTEDLEKIETF